MVDFSEAERIGHEEAFITFWKLRQDNDRTDDELREASKKLLKGCRQHFAAQVTRVSKMSGVIIPGQESTFREHIQALHDAESAEELVATCEKLIRRFNRTESWLRWWMRDDHVSMLFTSRRKMDAHVWDRMPDTTNAEEAMHWKLYSAVGRDHHLVEGLYGLKAVSEHYQRLMTACIGELS